MVFNRYYTYPSPSNASKLLSQIERKAPYGWKSCAMCDYVAVSQKGKLMELLPPSTPSARQYMTNLRCSATKSVLKLHHKYQHNYIAFISENLSKSQKQMQSKTNSTKLVVDIGRLLLTHLFWDLRHTIPLDHSPSLSFRRHQPEASPMHPSARPVSMPSRRASTGHCHLAAKLIGIDRTDLFGWGSETVACSNHLRSILMR